MVAMKAASLPFIDSAASSSVVILVTLPVSCFHYSPSAWFALQVLAADHAVILSSVGWGLSFWMSSDTSGMLMLLDTLFHYQISCCVHENRRSKMTACVLSVVQIVLCRPIWGRKSSHLAVEEVWVALNINHGCCPPLPADCLLQPWLQAHLQACVQDCGVAAALAACAENMAPALSQRASFMLSTKMLFENEVAVQFDWLYVPHPFTSDVMQWARSYEFLLIPILSYQLETKETFEETGRKFGLVLVFMLFL